MVLKLVYGGKTIEEKTIQVADDDFRATVPLVHEPKEVGIHAYRIELQPPVGDVFPGNKKVDCQVAVTDGRIKLLLVDDRPRWEFRYLRNLFAGRDKTVQLQWVLLHPDQLSGSGKPARVPASAARHYGEFEATMPPETAEDWLKFEVVVLGDLPPETLDEATLGVLKKFVGQQGGTLVVVAGPNFMPHAFADSPLAELLPANFAKASGPQIESPEPAYRLRLTREGTTHPIMSQRTNPTENLAIWNSLPPLDWRHPVLEVKPGATVLAYAEPVDLEELDSAAPVGVQAAAATAAEIDPAKLQLQKKNPLIVLQQYGAGNVLLLNFDRTWRLRYRVGDPYHHRFWTQVLRWATAAKLSAGTPHVRLGTGRLRYQGDEPVVVRAQLLDEESNPVSGGDVQARVYLDDQLVMKKHLASIADSRGLYQGDLGAMHTAGTYRVELTGSSVDTLRALDDTESVKTEFLVTPVERTSELVELSADWKIPREMAEPERRPRGRSGRRPEFVGRVPERIARRARREVHSLVGFMAPVDPDPRGGLRGMGPPQEGRTGMSTAPAQPPPLGKALSQPIVKKLEAVIRRIRRVMLLRGLLGLAAAILATLLTLMAVDAAVIFFSEAARWLLTLGGLAVILLAAAWFISRPLRWKISLAAIAQVVETQHPELQERISSTVEAPRTDGLGGRGPAKGACRLFRRLGRADRRPGRRGDAGSRARRPAEGSQHALGPAFPSRCGSAGRRAGPDLRALAAPCVGGLGPGGGPGDEPGERLLGQSPRPAGQPHGGHRRRGDPGSVGRRPAGPLRRGTGNDQCHGSRGTPKGPAGDRFPGPGRGRLELSGRDERLPLPGPRRPRAERVLPHRRRPQAAGPVDRGPLRLPRVHGPQAANVQGAAGRGGSGRRHPGDLGGHHDGADRPLAGATQRQAVGRARAGRRG